MKDFKDYTFADFNPTLPPLTSFFLLYQLFSNCRLRYCVLQILSILIFLNGIFLYFNRS